MLTPHEFATLMLVRQAPDQLDIYRAELDALLERQLVMLEHCASGARRAHLTGKGRMFLNALHPDDTSGSRHGDESGNRPGDDACARRAHNGHRNAGTLRLSGRATATQE